MLFLIFAIFVEYHVVHQCTHAVIFLKDYFKKVSKKAHKFYLNVIKSTKRIHVFKVKRSVLFVESLLNLVYLVV